MTSLFATTLRDSAKFSALFVTPAKAGAQAKSEASLDPGLRRGDGSAD
jgi:hypothetical protein